MELCNIFMQMCAHIFHAPHLKAKILALKILLLV